MHRYRFIILAVVFFILVVFIQPMIIDGLNNVDTPNYLVGAFIVLAGLMGIVGTNYKLMDVDALIAHDPTYKPQPGTLELGLLRMWHLTVVLLFPAFGLMLVGAFSNPEVETISGVAMVVFVGVFLFLEMFTVFLNGKGEVKREFSTWRQLQGDIMLLVFTFALYVMLISAIFDGSEISNLGDFLTFGLLFSTLWYCLILPARLGYIIEELVLSKGKKSKNRIIFEQTVVFLLLGLLPSVWKGIF